jgi:hypothetical protein
VSAPAISEQADDGRAVARRGDLVVIHVHHRDYILGSGVREHDDFEVGQVTSVTRDGRVRLYRPAGHFAGDLDGLGRPSRGHGLPSSGFQRALIMRAARVDVQGALATAGCHVWPGHEDHNRAYGSLEEVRAALRPHLLDRPGWERLRQAAAARKAARPLLSAAVRARGEEFRRLSEDYDRAVTAANTAYRQVYESTAAQGAA